MPTRSSGSLSDTRERGGTLRVRNTEPPMTLSAPQFFFAQDRSVADEAYAGDVVGIPNHGTCLLYTSDAADE